MNKSRRPSAPVREANWLQKNRLIVAAAAIVIVLIALAWFTGLPGKLGGGERTDPATMRAEYCNLLNPLVAQFDRAKSGAERWDGKPQSLEFELIRSGYVEVRYLLMNRAQHVPESLRPQSQALVGYLDNWFVELERSRNHAKRSGVPLTSFTGPPGQTYPAEAEKKLRERAAELKSRLGAEASCK